MTSRRSCPVAALGVALAILLFAATHVTAYEVAPVTDGGVLTGAVRFAVGAPPLPDNAQCLFVAHVTAPGPGERVRVENSDLIPHNTTVAVDFELRSSARIATAIRADARARLSDS